MIDVYETNRIRTTEMKSNEEWSSQLWTQFMQSRSQLRGSFFIRIKHITYSMYICLTMKSFRTSILALFIGLWDWLNSYQLILHLMVDMDLRLLVQGCWGSGWRGVGWVTRLYHFLLGSIITGCYTLKVHSLAGVRINQILSLLDKGNAPRSCTAATKLQKTHEFIHFYYF